MATIKDAKYVLETLSTLSQLEDSWKPANCNKKYTATKKPTKYCPDNEVISFLDINSGTCYHQSWATLHVRFM